MTSRLSNFKTNCAVCIVQFEQFHEIREKKEFLNRNYWNFEIKFITIMTSDA